MTLPQLLRPARGWLARERRGIGSAPAAAGRFAAEAVPVAALPADAAPLLPKVRAGPAAGGGACIYGEWRARLPTS